jgi:hypothetical protein
MLRRAATSSGSPWSFPEEKKTEWQAATTRRNSFGAFSAGIKVVLGGKQVKTFPHTQSE